MSLLVFSSASKISQGVIKRLHESKLFNNIVCADLFPNYYAIQRFVNFKSQLSKESETQLTDILISSKADIQQAVKSSTHILYITHDYYTLVPAKTNLLKAVSEVAKGASHIEKFVALTPVELDHYDEVNPWLTARRSEEEAIQNCPDMVHLKSDIIFGSDSTLASTLVSRILNNQSITFQPQFPNEGVHPIHCEDVAKVVETALKNKKIKGKAFALKGTERVTLGEVISTLQKHTGKPIKLNEDPIEKIVSPFNSNLISEKLYDPEYRNLTNFLRQYRTLETSGLNDLSTFKLKLKDLASAYPVNEVNESLYKAEETTIFEHYIKKFLYS